MKTLIAILLLSVVGFSTGCNERQAGASDKAANQQPSSPSESTPTPQTAADTKQEALNYRACMSLSNSLASEVKGDIFVLSNTAGDRRADIRDLEQIEQKVQEDTYWMAQRRQSNAYDVLGGMTNGDYTECAERFNSDSKQIREVVGSNAGVLQ